MFSEEVKKVCNHFKDKNKRKLRSHNFYNQIKSETNFLSEDVIINQRFWHILNNTKDIPKCLECGIKEVKWYNSYGKYSKFCSTKCAANNENVRTKFKQTNLNRYGVEYAIQFKDIFKKREQTYLKKYGVVHPMKSKKVQEKASKTYQSKSNEKKEEINNKRKQTNLDKYSVEYPMQVKEFRDKLSKSYQNKTKEKKEKKEKILKKQKQTNLKKYGVENVFQSEEIKNKSKQTNLNKYGVEYVFQSEEIKNKSKQTNLKNYGVEYPAQSKKIGEKIGIKNKINWQNKSEKEKEKISNKISISLQNKTKEEKEKISEKTKQTNLDRYGVDYTSQKHLSKYTLDKLSDPEYLKKQHHNKKKTLTEIAKELGLANCSSISHYFHKYNIPILTHFSSTGEKEVVSYIKEVYQKDFPTNTKQVITPLELDIYLEELNLAVEFNGTYWHSSEKKSKEYHFNKMKLCYEKNIRLINIYEYEWESNKEDIKHWLKKYIDNNSDDIITKDIYLKDIINKKEITLSLNWPINYELLKKNNFKFKETLESEFIKIKNFYIYDAGKIILERN